MAALPLFFLGLSGFVSLSQADITDQCPTHTKQQIPRFFTDIIQVPNHDCRCSSSEQGGLRYRDGELEVCNGMEYVRVCGAKKDEAPKLGKSLLNPADSCRQILEADRKARSGVYWLKTGNVTIRGYCFMETICNSAGWTLLLKMDGTKKTFHYDSYHWTTRSEFNVGAVHDGLSRTSEIKLSTYSYMPFSTLCLGFKTGEEFRWLDIAMETKQPSLYSIIGPNKFVSTHRGADAWLSFVPNGSLQTKCRKEGFNNLQSDKWWLTRVRIGILGNYEDDCDSPDSRIGLGSGGTYCGQKDFSAGNEAKCRPDNGDISTTGMAFILAQ